MKAAALNSDLGHTCCIMMLDTKQTSVQKNRCSARTNQPFELKFLGDDLDIANCITATFGLHASNSFVANGERPLKRCITLANLATES